MAKISITKSGEREQDLGEFSEAGIRFGRSLDERVLPGAQITASDDEVTVELQYPERDGNLSREAVVVSLLDVRSADDLKLRFDFERDGWAITMDRTREVEADGLVQTEVVVQDEEVAFVPAWNEEPDGTAEVVDDVALPPGCTMRRQGEWHEVRSRANERGRTCFVADGLSQAEAAEKAWAVFGRFVPRPDWERLMRAVERKSDPAETTKLAQALVTLQEAAIVADPVHGRTASTMAALMLAITALCEATGTSPAAIGKRMLELAASDLVPR